MVFRKFRYTDDSGRNSNIFSNDSIQNCKRKVHMGHKNKLSLKIATFANLLGR